MTKNIIKSGIFNLGSLGGDCFGAGDEHWDKVVLLLDGSSASTDASGTATVSNYGASNPNPQIAGPYGSAQDVLNFDGVNDRIDLSNLDLDGGDWTMECYAKFDSTLQYTGPWSCNREEVDTLTNDTGEFDFHIRTTSTDPTQKITFFMIDEDASVNLELTNNTAITSGWHHLAVSFVWDTNTLYLGVDGTVVSQSSARYRELHLGGNDELQLGRNRTNNRWFEGKLADVRFTKGVARYTANFTKPSTALPQVQAPLIKRPTRRWGGITGRSLVTSGGNLPTTGVLSLAEMLQASYTPAPATDPYWDDVILLMNGSDQLTDLSSVNQSSSLINRNGSGTGNGTTTGVTTATRTGPTGYGTVDVLRFDGTSSFIESSYSGLNDYNQDWTIEGWFYQTSTTGPRTYFSHWNGVNTQKGGPFTSSIDGEWIFLSDTPPGTQNWDIHTWQLGTGGGDYATLNGWNHIAVTRSGDTFRMFGNGEVVGQQTASNFNMNYTGNFTIGSSSSGSSGIQHFAGDAFDLRVTMGVARYTADFSSSLPTEPFPTA